MSLAALALAAALDDPQVLSVRVEAAAQGASVRIAVSAEPLGLLALREGDMLRVSFDATAPPSLELPPVAGPLLGIEVERLPPRVAFLLHLLPDTRYAVRAEGPVVSVRLGEVDAAGTAGEEMAPRREVDDLYLLLFPQETRAEHPPGLPGVQAEVPGGGSGERFGIRLGGITLQPALLIRYIDANATFLDTAQPTRVRYFEFEPRLGAFNPSLTLASDRVSLTYSMRFRSRTSGVPLLDTLSHFFDAGVNLPVSSFVVTGGYHYSRAALETREVDPGGEYFFDLAPFERHQWSLGLRTDFAGRLDFFASGFVNREEVLEEQSGWFSNENEGIGGGVAWELSDTSTTTLRYDFEHIPPAETREVIESRAHTLTWGLGGDIGTFAQGDLAVGYRWQDYPRAPVEGSEFRGIVLNANVRKDVGPARVRIGGRRNPQMSGYDRNAFYLSNGLTLGATAMGPLQIAFDGTVNYDWNTYFVDAPGIGEPREDTIRGWSVSASRRITRWSTLRLDYRRDHRTSNVPGYSTDTWAFVAELGLGFLGSK